MPSRNSKDFVNNTLVQALSRINESSNIIIQDKDAQPQTKKQKLDETMNSKYSKLIKVSKELSKSKILTIGLNQTQKKIRNTLAGGSENLENVLVFLIHDKEHDDVNAQLLAACR